MRKLCVLRLEYSFTAILLNLAQSSHSDHKISFSYQGFLMKRIHFTALLKVTESIFQKSHTCQVHSKPNSTGWKGFSDQLDHRCLNVRCFTFVIFFKWVLGLYLKNGQDFSVLLE